jgi:hypothetical protein
MSFVRGVARKRPIITRTDVMGIAEFVIGPAEGGTRWLHPFHGRHAMTETAGLRPAGWPPRHRFLPSCHFPFAAKRFMVPVRFALGEIEFMINIKGLA